MVIKDTVIIAINCHQVSDYRLCVPDECTSAAHRSHEGERDNCCVLSGR